MLSEQKMGLMPDVHAVLFYVQEMLGGLSIPGVEAGDAPTVLYDPARASRAIAYEFSYFRCC
jgi:hypothetical protein